MSKTLINEIKGSLKKPRMFHKVTVTPALATELLALNVDNRPTRKRKVENYAMLMEAGKWEYNGQGLMLSTEGKLINGQHRCEAVVQSGKAQVFNIETGLEAHVFSTIDTGITRTSSDALAVMGFKDPTNVSAMVRLILTHEMYGLQTIRSTQGGKRQKFDNTDIVEWVENCDKKYLDKVHDIATVIRKKNNLLSVGTVGAMIWIFAKKNKSDLNKAIEFFEKVYSGEDISLAHDSSVYLLREKLIMWKTAQFDITTDVKIATIIKAWNFYKEGQDVRRVAWGSNEEFPKIK